MGGGTWDDPFLAALADLRTRGDHGERAILVRDADGTYRVVCGPVAPEGATLLAAVGMQSKRALAALAIPVEA